MVKSAVPEWLALGRQDAAMNIVTFICQTQIWTLDQSVGGEIGSALITGARDPHGIPGAKLESRGTAGRLHVSDIEPITGRGQRLICLILDRLGEEAGTPNSQYSAAIIPRNNLNRTALVDFPLRCIQFHITERLIGSCISDRINRSDRSKWFCFIIRTRGDGVACPFEKKSGNQQADILVRYIVERLIGGSREHEFRLIQTGKLAGVKLEAKLVSGLDVPKGALKTKHHLPAAYYMYVYGTSAALRHESFMRVVQSCSASGEYSLLGSCAINQIRQA